MTIPNLEYIKVSDIENAGRGIVASTFIPKDTLLLRSEPPVAHVIFREYRKEVCAQCFLYDRGRTLPVRRNDIGKVFCSPECEEMWLEHEGELGLLAWKALHGFVQSRQKATNSRNVLLLQAKPDLQTIDTAWKQAGRVQKRGSVQKGRTNGHVALPGSIDADVLSYLLSGVLSFHGHPEKWRKDVLDLAMDPNPYRDRLDLEAHCNSFAQLCSLLPPELSEGCTSELCQNLVAATSHNSFGIRAGSDDGEEYMGYALYPDASYFNHSCSPNIAKKRVGFCWEFRACKDVPEGEECCITYLGGDEEDLSVTARRARLKMHWGFVCMCERCEIESKE